MKKFPWLGIDSKAIQHRLVVNFILLVLAYRFISFSPYFQHCQFLKTIDVNRRFEFPDPWIQTTPTWRSNSIFAKIFTRYVFLAGSTLFYPRIMIFRTHTRLCLPVHKDVREFSRCQWNLRDYRIFRIIRLGEPRDLSKRFFRFVSNILWCIAPVRASRFPL